jgi:hypothetical protein
MTGVKPLAGLALDHLGDPRQGPQVGRKPVGQRAAAERQIDPRQLPVIQTRLAAQAAGRLQARAALPRPGLIPPTRGHERHGQGPSDHRLGLAPRKPARRLEPACFQPPHLAFSGHASTWHRSPGCS